MALLRSGDSREVKTFERSIDAKPIMDAANFKKMENYVSYLTQKGEEKEKSKAYVEAIPTYLKVVDVLLVMAEVAPSYPLWLKCTSAADSFQKKIKSLIALASTQQKQEEGKLEQAKSDGALDKAEPKKQLEEKETIQPSIPAGR
jgi:hypothetical protein